MIRIVIVEDHTLFREGIKSLLGNVDGFKVVAEFANGKDFIDALFKIDCDIVLMDIEMPVMNGVDAAKEAKMKRPELQVVALSMYSDQKYYYEMIKAGVAGFVLKEASTTELEKAIREVYSGMGYFSPRLLQQIIINIPELEHKQRLINSLQLSEREVEVLELICEGYTNNEISEKLFLSPKTVEAHKSKLMKKTETKNTASLIIFAVKNELVEL
jgi:DNA-binding NarL/FixJ family response regulator